VNRKLIDQKILQNKPIPVLPTGLNHLMKIFDNDFISHQQLAKNLDSFPNISARLIFLANSAWASPSTPVDNLETACLNLGFLLVRSLSISLCVVSSFETVKRCSAFNSGIFWCSALLTAETAVKLAPKIIPQTQYNMATLHTAGVLHNLGLLWLAGNFPEQTSQALRLSSQNQDISVLQALRSIFGTDYCEVGGFLSRSWKLPEILISAIEQHSSESYPFSRYPSTFLIGYAAELVSAIQHGKQERPNFPSQSIINIDPLVLDETFVNLQGRYPETAKLAKTLFT
jgi:HD-like signal output (HDOD) protein